MFISNKSYVNKDFSEYQEGVLIAGIPAKILKKELKRILSPILEEKIKTFYYYNKENELYTMSIEDVDNPEDLIICYL